MQLLDPIRLLCHAPWSPAGSFAAVSTSFIFTVHFFINNSAASLIYSVPHTGTVRSCKIASMELPSQHTLTHIAIEVFSISSFVGGSRGLLFL